MAGVNRVSRRVLILPVYPTNPAPTKPALGQLDGAPRGEGGEGFVAAIETCYSTSYGCGCYSIPSRDDVEI
jgi:hypothetical protein